MCFLFAASGDIAAIGDIKDRSFCAKACSAAWSAHFATLPQILTRKRSAIPTNLTAKPGGRGKDNVVAAIHGSQADPSPAVRCLLSGRYFPAFPQYRSPDAHAGRAGPGRGAPAQSDLSACAAHGRDFDFP